MKIFDRPGFPTAHESASFWPKNLDAQVEFVSVDLIAAEHKQPDFPEKNPSGVLPVLQLEDGTYIAECMAITEYLDHFDDEPTLTGRTPREKAVIHMMQRPAEAEGARCGRPLLPSWHARSRR
ncbi:glutathione S-transferase N-terminal domain-containing protein [Ancylobacter defluvii]|uniref:GST N-terminal domain-containing protein n=1 Tax=Ancylobacter defluvii TaxID=1282440 RepID=A0A9W6NDN1_9HYPH|nr:glutathione S-transferase N-terminal domain-containing protein [Ancylobacter defluvii]GLK86726.1 hypothetical protein GCM10017653_47960 [Ancylobacter defluvii]